MELSVKGESVVKSAFDLPTYQRRLRHVRSLTLRNLQCKKFNWKDLNKLHVYFTLHTDKKKKEFYKSEIITGSLNPSWKSFDISRFEDEIDIHAKSVYVRVWIGWGSKSQGYKLLLDWCIHLSGLVFFSKRVQHDKSKYQPNTLVVGMFDQFFIPPEAPLKPDKIYCYEADASAIRNSYTINSLSRIHTVLRAIRQMQASVKRVHRDIEDRLLSSQEKADKLAEHEDLILRVSQMKSELVWQTSHLQQQKENLHSRNKSHREQSDMLQERFQHLEKNRFNLNEKRKSYFQTREKYIKESAQLLIRRKQLINELTTCIYPITELPKKDLCICGVRLPNSEDFQGQDEIMCSVSLGFASHLLMMMSYLLDFPLRYQIDFRGSRSQIIDHIHSKLTDKDRIFPLYAKGKEKFQFNYGVFLLNKNISQLRLYCGLSTTDLRLTLPNIKSLLELRLGIQFDHIGIMRPLADVKDFGSVPSIEKIDSANSLASGGRNSVTDSAEDALEVALRHKHDTNSEKENIPYIVNNKKQDFDETEDLFKPPSDGDQFFKVQSDTFQDTDSNNSGNSKKISENDTVDSALINGEGHTSTSSFTHNCSPGRTEGAGHPKRANFTPSPSPLSSDTNLLNVNQSSMNRENSVSSLSCDFSSGEEIQNSPGNPVFLASGCDSLGQTGELRGSESASKLSDMTDKSQTVTDKSETGLEVVIKDVQGR